MRMQFDYSQLGATLMLLAMWPGCHAWAQSTRDVPRIEEIVVSAQKRGEERLQDVPISVAVMTSESLANSSAVGIEDIGRSVAALSIASAGPGFSQMVLRGLSGGKTVGFYMDETPITFVQSPQQGVGNDPGLFDVNRVEVLLGPQGTLYGASSLGGTIRYIMNQPQLSEFDAKVKGTMSATEQGGFNYGVDAMVNTPLVTDTLGLRMSFYHRDYDGYIDSYPIDPQNHLAPASEGRRKNVNTEKTFGGRVALAYRPMENLTITPSIFYQHIELGAPYTFTSPPGSFENPIQLALVDQPVRDESALAALNIEADIGSVHLTSATSYYQRTKRIVEDTSSWIAGFFYPLQTYIYPVAQQTRLSNYAFTQELRASTDVGIAHLVAGVFYQRSTYYYRNRLELPAGYIDTFGDFLGGMPICYPCDAGGIPDTQKAIFGEVAFDLPGRVQLTLGGRFFDQSSRASASLGGLFAGGVTSYSTHESSEDGFNPKVGLSYAATDDVLVYATAAKGFREGGPVSPIPQDICGESLAQLGLSRAPTQYKSDSIWSHELGLKTSWLDRTLNVNAAAYYIDWSEIQQLVRLSCGYGFTGNFGEAESMGGELEIQYAPSEGVKLGLNVAYNQARLTEVPPGTQGAEGQVLEHAPKWHGSAWAEYSRQLGADLNGFARFDINSTSWQTNNFDKQSQYYLQPGYTLANLRLGLTRSSWEAGLFITNLFDKRAETALWGNSFGFDLFDQRAYALNRPRTIGMDLTLQF